jgi:hypothetical protein
VTGKPAVPPPEIRKPDQENLWEFTLGRIVTLGYDHDDRTPLWVRVDVIASGFIRISVGMTPDLRNFRLPLDQPVVVVLTRREGPLVTLTLREVSGLIARVQVTVRTDIPVAEQPEGRPA